MPLFTRTNPPAPELVSAQRFDYGVAILLALNSSGRHIYEGTAGGAGRDRRRARNKAARQTRAAHRKAARR